MNYTSISQSKKLLELGLNPESADMFYSHKTVFYNMMEHRLYVDEDDNWHLHQRSEIAMMDTGSEVSCWSLGALLELMPKRIPHRRCNEEGKEDWTYNWDLTPGAIYYGCGLINYSLTYESFVSFNYKDNPIEAAYNMVVWLLENNYIKKEKI